MAVGQARGRVVEHFAGLVDPRVERAKRHELLDLVVITICGVICGADNWVEIAEFGNARREWLSRFLGLPNGIPSPDTFERVFSWLDPDQFGACFMNWVQSVAELTQGEVVAIDPAPFYGQDPSITTTHFLQDTGCVAFPFVDVHPQIIAATLAVSSVPEAVTQAVVVILNQSQGEMCRGMG